MADLTARIKPKKSSTTGEVPQASDLEVAELAVNTADGKLFVKHTDNSIKEISGGSSGITQIQDATDFKLNPGATPYWGTKTTSSSVPNDGDWFPNGSNVMRFNPVDSSGVDWSSTLSTYNANTPLWYSTDGTNWTYIATGAFNWDNLPTWFQFNLSPFNVGTYTGPIYLSFSDPANIAGTPLQNGEILEWDATESAFMPTSARTLLGISEYATDAAAGTGGVASGALYYNTTSSDYRLKT